MARQSPKRPICFVITPFGEKLARVWEDAIEPAVKSAGFDCVRGDADLQQGAVMEFVIQQIFAADAIVADLTYSNANVFYELGVAHTIADKTVMIVSSSKSAPDLPFDISAYRAIAYQRNQLAGLRAQLELTLRELQRGTPSNGRPSNPVRQFAPAPSFSVPYLKEAKKHAIAELLATPGDAEAVLSAELRDGRTFDRRSDTTVFHEISHYMRLTRAGSPSGLLESLDRDLLLTGSPRFNPLAERVQQLFDLPCQYVSARVRADASSRDESPVLTPAQRTLRIVTTHGDELSASIDNGIGRGGDGTDYGLIVFAILPQGRRLIWLSGIHGKGTLGAYKCLIDHAGRILASVQRAGSAPGTAVTQLVRVKYTARSNEEGLDGIDGELLGDAVPSGLRAESSKGRAVLFDLGDVVMKFDRDRTYRSIGHLERSDYRRVRDRIRAEDESTRLVSDYELGGLSSEAFCDRLARLFGGGDRLRERLPEFWADIFWPNYEMFEVLDFLKKRKVALGLVSNTNALHLEQIKNDYPEIINLFDAQSVSYELKSAKPGDLIFNDAIEKMRRAGIEPRDMLYVDDVERHVEKMHRLGVDGFVYRSHSHFVLWLRKRGIYLPTVTDTGPTSA
jgi:FMN phosphatase YigB (HAD superfamily)